MSRFGDDDDSEYPSHWWAIDLERALNSGRGQRILRDILAALIALPMPYRLIAGSIIELGEWDEEGDRQIPTGAVCAVGAYAIHRGVQAGKDRADVLADLAEKYGDEQEDIWTTEWLGRSLGLARTVAHELAFQNDKRFGARTPEERWHAVFGWVWEQIKVEVTG